MEPLRKRKVLVIARALHKLAVTIEPDADDEDWADLSKEQKYAFVRTAHGLLTLWEALQS